MTLLSRLAYVSEKIGSLGNDYDVCLIDFSQYGIGIRADLGIQTSVDELFARDMSSYRLIIRVDGCPLWNEPLTLKDGTNKVSPYVALVA